MGGHIQGLVPMEPVEPSTERILLIITHLALSLKAGQAEGKQHNGGAQNTMLSNRSIIPPWPGSRCP